MRGWNANQVALLYVYTIKSVSTSFDTWDPSSLTSSAESSLRQVDVDALDTCFSPHSTTTSCSRTGSAVFRAAVALQLRGARDFALVCWVVLRSGDAWGATGTESMR